MCTEGWERIGMSKRITKWEEERGKVLWGRESDVKTLKAGWFDFLFFVKHRWCEDKSFSTQGLMFSFTNLTPSEFGTPEPLSRPFLILCHTHTLPSSSLLLYQIEKSCFICPATLKAFPLSLGVTPTNTNPSFELHPPLPATGAFRIQDRETNARKLAAT